jgi:hypothetical protein
MLMPVVLRRRRQVPGWPHEASTCGPFEVVGHLPLLPRLPR